MISSRLGAVLPRSLTTALIVVSIVSCASTPFAYARYVIDERAAAIEKKVSVTNDSGRSEGLMVLTQKEAPATQTVSKAQEQDSWRVVAELDSKILNLITFLTWTFGFMFSLVTVGAIVFGAVEFRAFERFKEKYDAKLEAFNNAFEQSKRDFKSESEKTIRLIYSEAKDEHERHLVRKLSSSIETEARRHLDEVRYNQLIASDVLMSYLTNEVAGGSDKPVSGADLRKLYAFRRSLVQVVNGNDSEIEVGLVNLRSTSGVFGRMTSGTLLNLLVKLKSQGRFETWKNDSHWDHLVLALEKASGVSRDEYVVQHEEAPNVGI